MSVNKPNLIWCDNTTEPFPSYREGGVVIEIPIAEQLAGFYHADPHKLRTLSGGKLQLISDCGCGDKSDLPADLPSRKIFNELGMTLAEVKALTKENLLKIKGIGEPSAEKVVEYFNNEVTE